MSGARQPRPDRPSPAAAPVGRTDFVARDAVRDIPVPSRARRSYSRGAMLRRRWTVRLAKFLLPLGALALLAAIAFWPELQRNEDQARVAFRRMSQNVADAVRVVAPRYQGVDDENRPYNVTADSATQAGQDAPIALEKPKADLMLSGNEWVYLESDSGLYDKTRDMLDLRGNVTIFHDNGMTFRTEVAHVQMKEGRAEGDRPVAAQGSFGTITGDGFRIEDRGQDVFFTGNTHAMLEGSR
ncbi:LPS export ABC transporter periplasmic protein LptC [Roseomonas elaeocarpi]|uniref:LPS export ABC transporter periplasmic protein LptC n=1 Tax=Roseomonas elaeocarpi TaxID=907779 RepID=A0ABV6JUN7_9PROT